MSSLPKLVVINLVVVTIGALQFSVPAIANKRTTPLISLAIRSLTLS